MLTIVLKQNSEIIILKRFRIASFRLKSETIFLGEETPLPQTPTPSVLRRLAAPPAAAASPSATIVLIMPPPNEKPEATSLV